MAGSLKHITENYDEFPIYQGTGLINDSIGDALETVEELAFIVFSIWHRWGGHLIVPCLQQEYYGCSRGERPWPSWWKPEISEEE